MKSEMCVCSISLKNEQEVLWGWEQDNAKVSAGLVGDSVPGSEGPEAAWRDAQLPADLPLPSSPVLDADPEVIELPRPLLFILPLVPLVLPPKLLQLAEAVGEQEVWG